MKNIDLNKKTTLVTIVSLLFATLCSCRSDFDWRINRLSDFSKQFVDQYGWPDERQTWNTAIQFSVNAEIEMGETWTMKIYTADPDTYPEKSYLIGQYEVSADSLISVAVDGPYTLHTLCVGIENGTYFAKKNVVPDDNDAVEVAFYEHNLESGSLPQAPKMSYLIAYEVVDSVSNYLDYNDVVIEVVHVSGEETADVKLCAIGAKEEMAVNYEYDGERVPVFANVHNAFGYRLTDRLVNVTTGKHNFREREVYSGLIVGEDFSMANDAGRFVVSLKHKGKTLRFYLYPANDQYLGTPSNVLVIANPTWDWLSEGASYNLDRSSFTFWVKSYREYNQWWDNIWDAGDLTLYEGNTYRPAYDYQDLLISAEDIKAAGGVLPEIDYSRLQPYTNEEIGADVGFVITGRRGGDVRVSLQRTDGGSFEWYEGDATVHVFENYNVDAGRGNAEACHILLSTKTMKAIVSKQANLVVKFDKNDTQAEINSVWIRRR